jgi:hypothetical protein
MNTTFRKKVVLIGALMPGGLGVFQVSVSVAALEHDQHGASSGHPNGSTQEAGKASRTPAPDVAHGTMSHAKTQHGNRAQGPSGRKTTDQDHSQHVKGAGSSHEH